MKLMKIKVKTYNIGDGFRLEVATDSKKNEIDAYIYHEDYAVKQHIYGQMLDDTTEEDFLESVMYGIDDEIALYKKEHFDPSKEDIAFGILYNLSELYLSDDGETSLGNLTSKDYCSIQLNAVQATLKNLGLITQEDYDKALEIAAKNIAKEAADQKPVDLVTDM